MQLKDIKNVEPIACEICLSEIPDDVRLNVEADEYVAQYFGWECYHRWIEQKQKNTEPNKK